MSSVALWGVTKTFHRGIEAVHALRDVDLVLGRGEVVALVGPSGSGKSTLLNVLGGWEAPDAGAVWWPDGGPSRSQPWARLGMVPQGLGLLEDLSIAENVALPARLAARRDCDATASMERLGIAHLAPRSPSEVSVGEQQRTAVARALLLGPAVVLADEPTAHQDAGFGGVVLDALRDAARAGAACLVATHNPEAMRDADRVITMRDGELHD